MNSYLHWCCSLSTDVWVLTHRKGSCRVLQHVSAAWSWRQHHDSDRCAVVFIISFILTVLLSLRHVVDIVCWLLHILTHAGVRPTLRFETEDGGGILIKLKAFTELHDVTTQTTVIFRSFTHLHLINFVNQIFILFSWRISSAYFCHKSSAQNGYPKSEIEPIFQTLWCLCKTRGPRNKTDYIALNLGTFSLSAVYK
jgi:hypothetical protein